MPSCWFITGTDTEVGKTLSSCALLEAAKKAGHRCAAYKPVAAGSEPSDQGLRNEDALLLQAHSGVALGYGEVNPLALAEPTSPHIASQAEGRPIDTVVLSAGLAHLKTRADWILVEGAGGWLTPLTDQLSLADWVTNEQLPVILVVGMKLGCINHALLTAQAVAQSGLPLAGWIANAVLPPQRRHREYLATLKAQLKAPCLGEIPHLSQGQQISGDWLDISALTNR